MGGMRYCLNNVRLTITINILLNHERNDQLLSMQREIVKSKVGSRHLIFVCTFFLYKFRRQYNDKIMVINGMLNGQLNV